MIYDTLSFSVTKKDMTPSEETMLAYPDDTKYLKGKQLIKITVQLNAKDVNWNYVDPYTFFFKSLDDTPYWETKPSPYSAFEPFTCSCGSGGCAGIWDGIHVKVRGHSIEWRAKKEYGYKFLEKNYYNFSKTQYIEALTNLYKTIQKLSLELGDNFIVDPGHHEGSMTTGHQFLEFINNEVKPENNFWK